jgi:hypothetical protein
MASVLHGKILSKQLRTQKKTWSNHDDVIDPQVIALERGQIYNSELDDHSKHIFPFIPVFPGVLNLLKSSFSQFPFNSCFEPGTNHASLTAWPMLNVYHFGF